MPRISLFILVIFPVLLTAQSATDPNAAILQRLDRLEKQNEELLTEIRGLRSALNALQPSAAPAPVSANAEPSAPTIEERLNVVENRVEEQQQTKVEASQRFPVALHGMVLFNAFANSQAAPPANIYPALLTGQDRSGASFQQSQFGFDFNGPELPGNGRVSASLNLDFYGGSSYAYSLRIRRAAVNFDWPDRSVLVGQEKALISQRAPDSLAEVAIPPLADAGNPWAWVPQARYTEHIHFGEQAGIDAQASVLETSETYDYDPYSNRLVGDPTRPGFETRINFWRQSGDTRFEIAPGFHTSESHVYGYTVPSQFGTVDYLIQPAKWLKITGLVLGGRNTAVFGGFSDGFFRPLGGDPMPVRSIGGWTQFSFPLTARLTLNAFGGMQAPETSGLNAGSITHTAAYAMNVRYRIAPNVLIGAEVLQSRYGFENQAHLIDNHYDVAIGYLF